MHPEKQKIENAKLKTRIKENREYRLSRVKLLADMHSIDACIYERKYEANMVMYKYRVMVRENSMTKAQRITYAKTRLRKRFTTSI